MLLFEIELGISVILSPDNSKNSAFSTWIPISYPARISALEPSTRL